MEQEEVTIIFILCYFILVIALIAGLILFSKQARKYRKKFTSEKQEMEIQHTGEILTIQLESQEQTMMHIGTEIHDNVGQKLTLASIYAKQLSTGSLEGKENKIATVGNIIDESLSELRQLSKTLTNPELANATLLFLLQEEAKRINVSGICHVSINHSGSDIILPPADKNILFRILQEFIQNSLRHSDCRRIAISLEKDNDKLVVTAKDNGKGFDTSVASTGIGLQTMQKRAEQLNAVYQLKSEVGKGTTLTLKLPLAK